MIALELQPIKRWLPVAAPRRLVAAVPNIAPRLLVDLHGFSGAIGAEELPRLSTVSGSDEVERATAFSALESPVAITPRRV